MDPRLSGYHSCNSVKINKWQVFYWNLLWSVLSGSEIIQSVCFDIDIFKVTG